MWDLVRGDGIAEWLEHLTSDQEVAGLNSPLNCMSLWIKAKINVGRWEVYVKD